MLDGGSATVDGISAFNQKEGIYYFATDFVSDLIFSSDVRKGTNLAPIDIGAQSIEGLIFDNTGNQLLVLYELKGLIGLAAVTTQNVRQVTSIPSTYNANYIMVGAVDNQANFYLTAKVGTSSALTYAVATISLTSGLIANSANLSATCNVFPQHLEWDQSSSSLIGGAMSSEANTLVYWFLKINPKDGSCVKTQLKVAEGIVTCWTFDPIKRVLWFGEAINGGAYLYFYNVDSNVLSNGIKIGGFAVPESLQFSIN